MVMTILVAIGGVVLADWLFVGKVTAGFSDFDYRYWPFTWARLITVALAALTAAVSGVAFTPGAMPRWPLFVWAVVFGLWLFVAIDDVARQRRLGWRKPPRHSDPEE
jgi:hypothetical protein